jgi:hypothetical protein
MTPSSYRHILVVVDKFTKQIEVRAIATVMSKEAAKSWKTSPTASVYRTGSSLT